jgi:uncharacterized protein (TIGR02145 family)
MKKLVFVLVIIVAVLIPVNVFAQADSFIDFAGFPHIPGGFIVGMAKTTDENTLILTADEGFPNNFRTFESAILRGRPISAERFTLNLFSVHNRRRFSGSAVIPANSLNISVYINNSANIDTASLTPTRVFSNRGSIVVSGGRGLITFSDLYEIDTTTGFPMNSRDDGVVINGVHWATRNVDRIGFFTERAEQAGYVFTWDSNREWYSAEQDTRGALSLGWASQYSRASQWREANDPCPPGWRLPTMEEWLSLLDTTRVTNEWATLNGVTGRRFTDRATGASMFLPAGGRWVITDNFRDLTKIDVGTGGFYWSANPRTMDEFTAYYFEFNNGRARIWSDYKTTLNSIRPVSDGTLRNEP